VIVTLVTLFIAGSIFLAAFGLGRPIVRGLRVLEEDLLAVTVWSIVVGLILAGTILALMGLLGILHVSYIAILTMMSGFWGAGEVIRDQIQRYERSRDPKTLTVDALDENNESSWPAPSRWLGRVVLALAAVACLGSLLGALAPPTAGDALCYHLELPKQFLAHNALFFHPYHDNATFPLLVEMWYLWALALDGPVAASVIHWGAGILLGLATVLLASPILGRPWAWIAGAVVVLVPGVTNQMTAPLNDVALALLLTLAVAAWWRVVVDQEDRRWLVLAGVAAGGALGTKYIALVFAGAMGATSCWMYWRRPRRRRALLEAAVTISILAVAFGGFWYVRAARHRGNPVYPFAGEIFAQDAPHAKTTLPESKAKLGRSPLAAIQAPWQITMHPERFGGRGHQLGALWLVTLPGLFWTRRLRGLHGLLAVALFYGFFWFLLRQNVRFLFPILPMLALGTVWVWIEMRRLPALPRVLAATAQAGLLLAFALAAVERTTDRAAVALGLESREDYLFRAEPSYPAASIANVMLEPDDHILSQDYRAFYFNCRVTQESVFRRETGYDREITSPSQLSRRLRRAGFTHLLLAENESSRGIQFDPTLSRLAELEPASPALRPTVTLIDYRRGPDCDGVRRRYRLVMLR